MKLKTLRQIFVEYEIGEIYPENLPSEIYNIIEITDLNENLLKLTNLFEPTRVDILKLLYPAFGITENDRLIKTEKLELLINRWLRNKMESQTLLDRIQYFELENCLNSESLEWFLKNLTQTIYGNWVPGDEWDWTIVNIQNDFKKIKNRYSEYLIKTSC